ncbi:MAG: hypothetical protein U1A77_11150 [Pirellulales bacterium]
MAIPVTVKNWMKARREHERDPLNTPRVLPILKIGNKWYFEDSRLQEYRNVCNFMDTIKM